MTLKKLLGLESFIGLKDVEIMQRIREAQAEHKEIIEFCSGGKIVRIHVPEVHPEGTTQRFDGYFEGI